MNNKRRLFITIILLLAVFMPAAYANDSVGTTAAGGIRFGKTTAIVMEDEDLSISPDRVQVNYIFRNTTRHAVTAQVFFPLPPYQVAGANISWDDEVGAAKRAPFANFSVEVNGVPVAFKISTRAVIGHNDITAILQKADVPLNPELAAGRMPLTVNQQAALAHWQAKARQLNLLDKQGNPRWQKQVIYYWTQTFPANKAIQISHQYRPAAGEFFSAAFPGATPLKLQQEFIQRTMALFKLNVAAMENKQAFMAWLKQRLAGTPGANAIYAFYYNVDYILTTGANWAGPIKHFSLTLRYPPDGAVAYKPFYAGKAVALSHKPGAIQIQLRNFTPEKNLRLLFGSARALVN